VRRRLLSLKIALALFAFAFRSHAEGPAAAFEAANRLYDQGKYAEAAAAFEHLLQSGVSSPAACFNLGNAFFKSGQIGRAISAYHQAERIVPRDPDLRANLRFARNQIQGPTLAPASWQTWLRKLTLNEWTLLAAAALWLWFLLLAFLQWRPDLRRSSRNFVILLALASVFFCACLAGAYYGDRSRPTAIIVSRDANAHSSPFEGSPNAFTLHDGAEVRILDKHADQKEEWVQVSTDARRIGWVRRDQLLLATIP
jgi:tetratricopeptide (TPR) repeat protein